MTELTRPLERPVLDVDRLVQRAVTGSGADGDLLDGYLEILSDVAATGRRLAGHEISSRRTAGIVAAERDVSLAAVVDLHLSVTWMAWRHLPERHGHPGDDRVTAVLRAANDTVVALADGYQTAQRAAIRHQEGLRRELVDDLLTGTSEPAQLLERAARFGLGLAGQHAVLVARAARPLTDGGAPARDIDRRLRAAVGSPALITTKAGHLVCVVAGGDRLMRTLVDVVRAVEPDCRIAVGRPHTGPLGVARSYGEARDVLHTADRLGLDAPVLRAADFLVFQVLFRDQPAICDLVSSVLGPLRRARGGARPLLDTLEAYFNTGSAVAAAERLAIGVRTVTYRLDRIRSLSGYHPTDPTHRLTLQAAVLGARLLHWPEKPLPDA